MLQRRVGHGDHRLVGRQTVGFDDDAAAFTFGRIQERSKLVERDLLLPELYSFVRVSFILAARDVA